VLALHGGRAENGELQVMCEMLGIPFTGPVGFVASRLRQDRGQTLCAIAGVKAPIGLRLEDYRRRAGRVHKLIAKPVRDGSSYGLIFVNSTQDLAAVRNAAKTEEYVMNHSSREWKRPAACWSNRDGSLSRSPPIEIVPCGSGFDDTAKYLLK